MIETRDLGQRHIAALWDDVNSCPLDPSVAAERLTEVLRTIEEQQAQLMGLKLHAIETARLAGVDAVIDEVRHSVRTDPKRASASIKLAADLGERFPLIACALQEGTLSLPQAEAIVVGLRKLSGQLTRSELQQCQTTILEYAETFGPSELRTLAARLVEVIDPDHADADEAKRLAAEERAARRSRFLRLSPDYHGSMLISGKLPVADAALLSAQLDALMPPISSYRDADETPPPDVRRVDALVLLTQEAANSGELPAHGGDRPRVHITLDYETLTSGMGRVGLLGVDGVDGLSAGDARRLACDAGLIPMVLDGKSRPLDVGRENRLFTPGIRAALVERDQACAFPGCTASPAACEAHHITPWWAGGKTAIHNAALLCPHHHRLVEPDPGRSSESQWQVQLDSETGLPRFTPPKHIDPRQRPRQHRRFLLRNLVAPGEAPPCPPHGPDTREVPETSSAVVSPLTDLEELLRRSAAVWGVPPAVTHA